MSHPLLGWTLSISALLGGAFVDAANEVLDMLLSFGGLILLCANIYFTILKVQKMRAEKKAKELETASTQSEDI